MKIRRILCAFLLSLSMLCCFETTAFAYKSPDASRPVSLTVYFGKNGKGYEGVEFQIYRIATVSSDIEFTLVGDFSTYPVKVNDLGNADWRALAQTLDSYVARDNLKPLRIEKTGTNGNATFKDLTSGLYLVTGNRYYQDRYIYTPEPFLICLPYLDKNTDTWEYDVTATCKYDDDYNPPTSRKEKIAVDIKVLKVWQDNANADKRPKEITVQLLQNNKVFDTVALNESNNWKYTWHDLDMKYTWRVVEYNTPDGYTVVVERQGNAFVVTNRWTPDTPDGPQPRDGDPHEPQLPQTGMLWWPVPLMAFAGLLLFLIGWRVLHRAGR